MSVHRDSRWWWTLMVVPAVAVSACGGSRLSHDAVVAAINGGPLPATQVQSQAARPGAEATIAQNGASASAPVSSATGTPSGGGAGVTSSSTGSAAAGAVAGHTSQAGAATGPAAAADRPAGPLAPILIGNVGTYTGPAGSTTAGSDTMVQVWAQWTNAHGGIAGHPVQVFTADDGGDPQKSLSLVKDMVESKHVVAFVNNMVPFTIQAQLPYLHQHNIPIVGGDNTGPVWSSDSLAFPQGTTMGEVLFGDYRVAHERNLTKLGIVYCAESTSCSYMHDYSVNTGAPRAGETVVYQSQVSITQPDYTAQCLGAQSAGAQAILLAVDSNSIMRFAASCSRQNYHPLYVATSVQATSDLEGKPDLEGFLTASPVFPYMVGNTPATAQFHQAIQQFAPSLRPSGAAAFAWASGQLLAKAAAQVGPQPTSQDILNGLWKLRGETLGGLTPPLTYAKDQPTPPIQCYYLIEIKGGRWTSPSGDTYSCP